MPQVIVTHAYRLVAMVDLSILFIRLLKNALDQFIPERFATFKDRFLDRFARL